MPSVYFKMADMTH